ncbi:MAG TPA: anti-sigma factor [Vicinamibacterales bacterium]|nr:anti-sigma factor [Vicinamibacterales bacterium]
MDCSSSSEAIAEFLDGTLDPAQQRALERHVESCGPCRALVADLKTIQAAAFTLDRQPAPRHVFDAVRTRIAAEPRPSTGGRVLGWPRTRGSWAVLAAAAALVLATTAGIYPLLRSADRHDDEQAAATEGADVVATVQAELQAAEQHYDKAIAGLEQIARSESSALEPQVAAVLQKNLQVIDQAIGESRKALEVQPASTDAQDSLFDAMRSKVALLQQTVELINEMRKGNQAEAGRLIQGLNQ